MANFDFLKGNIETIILNSLFSSDKYGYEITKEIKEKTDNQYEIKQATLYGYLKRLESKGLVQSYWGEESHGGRRRYFSLSEQGRDVCKKFSAEWNFHKNVLKNLVPDEVDDEDFSGDKQTGRDRFFGSKTAPQKKHIKSDVENQKIAEELKKLTQQEQVVADVTAADSIFFEAKPKHEDISLFDEISRSIKSEREDLTKFSLSSLDFQPQNQFNTDDNFREDLSTLFTDNITSLKTTDVVEKKKAAPLPRIPNTSPAFDPETIARVKNNTFNPTPAQSTPTLANKSHDLDKQTKSAIFQSGMDFNELEKETEIQKHYKNALGELLGEQINDTDLKISRLSPQEVKAENRNTEGNIVELAEEFSKDGLKIRFFNSAVSQYRAVPMLLKNKINCAAAWTSLLLFTAALAMILIFRRGVSFAPIAYSVLIFLLFPVYFTAIYIKRPYIQVKPKHNIAYTIINRLIIFVFGILFVLCIDLILLRLDFQDFNKMLYQFLIPVLALAQLPLSELVYVWFLRFKSFYN